MDDKLGTKSLVKFSERFRMSEGSWTATSPYSNLYPELKITYC